ncbi:DUF726-domain-containing protein [Polychaeton citri CBS 116435]|uniref:DUF726-domain-containing protein n=1 Tax=Polychaeton citri CBS 116435 TaxID=1314669 RepID=A0A9P4UI04_9PEZI|nr:DUF726-domain-containing protein [Polychaeton citri CBS 116435]
MPSEGHSPAVSSPETNGGPSPDAAIARSTTVDGNLEQTNQQLPQADEFGLPVRPPRRRQWSGRSSGSESKTDANGEKTVEVAGEALKPGSQEHGVEVKGLIAQEHPSASGGPSTTHEGAGNLQGDRAFRNHAEAQDDIDAVKKTENPRASTSERNRHSAMISEWSHQQLTTQPQVEDDGPGESLKWQEMPSLATFRQYDDWGKVTARAYDEVDDNQVYGYSGLGGAGKGYTRVQVDEDAQSATSMDENTAYLFKGETSNALDNDDEARDLVTQMQTTKQLLTEGQRIAYVGIVRLSLAQMLGDIEILERTKGAKKAIEFGLESLKMWSQKMMVRLYTHMELDGAEQIMVEQLSEHGVIACDMTPTLMANARVKNPQFDQQQTSAPDTSSAKSSFQSTRPTLSDDRTAISAREDTSHTTLPDGRISTSPPNTEQENENHAAADGPPPTYEEASADSLTVQAELGSSRSIDLDIRWTVLCDLFLLLIADSTYDARSRRLLELVGASLSVDWCEICRFEKRVTDALEMQEQAEKETWNEEEHLENRRKKAFKRRLMFMGLCTVGGGLVIGLSAGLLAPVIGAGLAAGFTTIGVSGTGAFLGGAGGAAIIGTTGALTGGTVGVRAGSRRTGAVKTFEYRPLHNNKRVNLIVTVSGWMTGKVDDVRLPFSTVDSIMGDIYSIYWEPEMLQSTGQTINILATEALTQTIQQILGSTVLTALMAGISLPLILTKLSYLIDNPWSVSLARADAAGLILADSLVDRNLGARPITLVGYSLGSRVIFSCLKELAARGAQGLVQNVYLFGTPVVAKKDEYLRARTVVSGRFVNGYATNDWILGYLFRATAGGIMRVAGLSTVDIPGVENMDLTETVPGHMAYRGKMPVLLRQCGWLVESDEFSEIEDPDPDNHEARQRELITEIEAARMELEQKEKAAGGGKKKGIKSWFSMGKKSSKQRKDWETYDAEKIAASGESEDAEKFAAANQDVMFDVDAIRREALQLALDGGDIEEIKRHISIRELQSTMPAMRISSAPSTPQITHEGASNSSWLGHPQSSQYRSTDTTQNTRTQDPTVYGGVEHGEDEVSLAFDDDVRPAVRSAESFNHGSSRMSLSTASLAGSGRLSMELPAPPANARNRSPHALGERPYLKSSLSRQHFGDSNDSMPSKQPERNVWDNDDDFGKEKEVSMTFD